MSINVPDSVALIKTGKGDLYKNLLTIGKSNAVEYRTLVQSFLYYEDDPMIARLALQILCRYWNLTTSYEDVLIDFIKGVRWDVDGDVRTMAIGCSDQILLSTQRKELPQLVLNIIESPDEDEVDRQAAYCAFAIAFGAKPSELPSPARFDIESDIDSVVLEKAHKIIKILNT